MAVFNYSQFRPSDVETEEKETLQCTLNGFEVDNTKSEYVLKLSNRIKLTFA